MIGRILYGACAIGLVAATAVMAEPSNVAAGSSSVAEPKSDANRQICRTTADTGTRLGRTRECHTVQEWEEIHRHRGNEADRYQGGH
jgi:hypothetical protein